MGQAKENVAEADEKVAERRGVKWGNVGRIIQDRKKCRKIWKSIQDN